MMKQQMESESRWEMLLFDYIEGNLSPKEAAEVEKIIANSPSSRAEVESWKRTQLPPSPPPSYPHKAKLKKAASPPLLTMGILSWGRMAALFIIGILCGLWIGYYLWWTRPMPQSAQAKHTADPKLPTNQAEYLPPLPIASIIDQSPASLLPPSPSPHTTPISLEPPTTSPQERLSNPLELLPTRTTQWQPISPTPPKTSPTHFQVHSTTPSRPYLSQHLPIVNITFKKQNTPYQQHYHAEIQWKKQHVKITARTLKPKYWFPYAMIKLNQVIMAQLTPNTSNNH